MVNLLSLEFIKLHINLYVININISKICKYHLVVSIRRLMAGYSLLLNHKNMKMIRQVEVALMGKTSNSLQ